LKRDLGRSATGPKASRMGDQVNRIAGLALKRGKSVDFTGYDQRAQGPRCNDVNSGNER
jgi:hypothetical protein